MAKVMLDLRMVRGPLHGIARYALELARRLPLLEPTWQFVGLTGPEGLPSDLHELTPRIPLTRSTADFLSPGEQAALLAALVRHLPSLFHATSFSLPLLWPGALVATIHDVNHLALPESRSAVRTAYYRAIVGPRARRARGVITVSEFSRAEIEHHLNIPGDKMTVIPNGVDEIFRPPTPEAIADFKARRGIPTKYFAVIGSTKSHKNLNVLKAIAKSLPAPLVLLAGRGAKRALGFGAGVLELSPLPDNDLICFYAGALAALIPSKYEGFGFPALEAMACGAPVIASRSGALPEVMFDAGMLIDPEDEQAWKDACLKLFWDEALRAELGAKGVARASHFSWDECARATMNVYRRALG